MIQNKMFSQALEDSKRRRKSWQEIENERRWEERRDWRSFAHRPVRNGDVYITRTICSEQNSCLNEAIVSAFVTDLSIARIWSENGVAGDCERQKTN
jgi:hypothetical protein